MAHRTFRTSIARGPRPWAFKNSASWERPKKPIIPYNAAIELLCQLMLFPVFGWMSVERSAAVTFGKDSATMLGFEGASLPMELQSLPQKGRSPSGFCD